MFYLQTTIGKSIPFDQDFWVLNGAVIFFG